LLVLDGITIDAWLPYISVSFCPIGEKCGITQGTKEILKVSGYCERPITSSLLPFSDLIMTVVRAPYSGPSRKLVVALDIGTTFSGAAYALLEPGQVPETQFVTK